MQFINGVYYGLRSCGLLHDYFLLSNIHVGVKSDKIVLLFTKVEAYLVPRYVTDDNVSENDVANH
jgi:hypothetical protein